ncbi:MAG: hypothetical protein AUH29_00430 [Candidatus Rokubacteria bacterium 13_1_40CM_69_27]|nr:MAG: hypothetical protein AUH29_00430 [Candidatus Rokubacteria bacterium 13_1_40CM_69_27]
MRTRASSRIGLAAWLASALGLALYAGAALVILTLDLGVSLPGPWWMPLVLPPFVYAVFFLIGLWCFSLERALVALGALGGVHALLAVGTVTLFAVAAPAVGGPVEAPWSSPAVTLLPLVGALLILSPYSPLLETRSRPARRDVRATSRPSPPSPPPAPPAPAAPSPGPRRAEDQDAPTPPAPAAQPDRVIVPPPAKAPTPETRPAPRLAPRPEPRPERARPPAAEPVEEMIRIPFARVVDQLPAEMFLLTRDRVSANLLEAGHLLVPQRLILPQLGEGLVQVGWEVVAEQFPRQALALPDVEIIRLIANGALVLPLDEIVRQMPPELFVVSTPTMDVRGIEDFPPPFQPHVPPPSAMTEELALATPVEEPTDVGEEPAEPTAVETAPGIDAVSTDAETPSEPEREGSLAAVLPEPSPVGLDPGPEAPAALVEAPLERQTSSTAMEGGETLEAQRVAALLGPVMSPLEMHPRQGGGATLFTVVSPGLRAEAIADTAVRVLPFLADARLPAPVTQATLRATDAAVVLTPFAAAAVTGSVLVTAVASGAPLALLERLSLRAAGEGRVAGRGGARSGRFGIPDQPREPRSAGAGELRDATVPADVGALADSLRAFGSVTPTVLRDPAGTLLVYLFLRPGLPALPIGQFTRDLHGALEAAEIGSVSSVVLRLETARVVVRTVETTVSCTTLLVVGGGTLDRPGLARLQLDRAATRLRGAPKG